MSKYVSTKCHRLRPAPMFVTFPASRTGGYAPALRGRHSDTSSGNTGSMKGKQIAPKNISSLNNLPL